MESETESAPPSEPTLYIQEGGRKIGEGVYGCIFQPPLLCKGRRLKNPRTGRLGKLTAKEDIANELRAAIHFKHASEAKKYLILPDLKTVCVPQPQEKQREPDLAGCEPVQKFGYDDMLHYQVEYGGKTLHNKLENVAVFSKDFSFDAFMLRMLEIGAYLALHGIVHNDLHSNNILVNSAYVPRLIDFGRSFIAKDISIQRVNELIAKYMPELGQVPPESSAQDGIEGGVGFSEILRDLETKKGGLLHAERYLGLSRRVQMAEFKAFWMTSRAAQGRDWVAFLKLYWSVIDSWSIGSILLGILRKLLSMKQFAESTTWKGGQQRIRAVLRGMLRASPRERMDCVEALALFDPMNDMVTGQGGRAWLESRQQNRERLRKQGA
jgi:serine/threonine protein kinase